MRKARYLTLCVIIALLALSGVEAFSQESLIFENFESVSASIARGKWKPWQCQASTEFIKRNEHWTKALKLRYDMASPGRKSCGVIIKCDKADLSEFRYLTIFIKSEAFGSIPEVLEVELKSGTRFFSQEARSLVTSEWQAIIIPLEGFKKRLDDCEKIDGLRIVLNENFLLNKQGTVYIDDIFVSGGKETFKPGEVEIVEEFDDTEEVTEIDKIIREVVAGEIEKVEEIVPEVRETSLRHTPGEAEKLARIVAPEFELPMPEKIEKILSQVQPEPRTEIKAEDIAEPKAALGGVAKAVATAPAKVLRMVLPRFMSEPSKKPESPVNVKTRTISGAVIKRPTTFAPENVVRMVLPRFMTEKPKEKPPEAVKRVRIKRPTPGAKPTPEVSAKPSAKQDKPKSKTFLNALFGGKKAKPRAKKAKKIKKTKPLPRRQAGEVFAKPSAKQDKPTPKSRRAGKPKPKKKKGGVIKPKFIPAGAEIEISEVPAEVVGKPVYKRSLRDDLPKEDDDVIVVDKMYDAMLHIEKGVAYAEERSFHQAEEEFKKAIAVDPTWADAYLRLGIIYDEGLFNKEEAAKCYEKFLELDTSLDFERRERVEKWIADAMSVPTG